MLTEIDSRLLEKIADLTGKPVGAFNIRKDSGCEARQSTEHIEIVPQPEGKRGIIILHFPADILAVLQGKALYRISIIFLFRGEGINNIKIFLFFLQKSRITKKNPLVECRFLIIKCQFPRCVFLLRRSRCRKAGLKAIF